MTYCTVQAVGGYTVDGVPTMGVERKVGCSPLILRDEQIRSSIRTDKSGTKSGADEKTVYARFLMEPTAAVKLGEKVSLNGLEMRVVEVYPRYMFGGALHHYQVDLERWLPEQE